MGWINNQIERTKLSSNAAISNGKVFLLFDDENQEIVIDTPFIDGQSLLTLKNDLKYFPYNAIEKYEVYLDVDQKISKGAIGALTGAALFGTVGMVVGGLARRGVDKSKIKSAGVLIKISGINYKIDTIQQGSKTIVDDTIQIGNKLDEIMSSNVINEETGPEYVADEISKLAELNAKGLITDEEFKTQKQKLLN